jgi:hypothetical protein
MIIGFAVILTYFLVLPEPVEILSKKFIDWGSILVAASIGLGVIYMVRTHVKRINERKQGEWIYSIIVVVTILIFPVLYFALGNKSTVYTQVYDLLINVIGNGVWGILIFSTTAAVYKAFSVKKFNGVLLLLAAIVVMMSTAPIGEVIWSGFGVLGPWVLDIPSTGSYRGMLITAALGLIALGFRTLFGFETSYVGGGESGE